jgi:TolA-binding protein
MQGQFKLWEIGTTVPIGLFQSAGFSWLGEHDGSVDVMTADAEGRLVPSGETLENSHNTFLASYAINPWNRLSVGASVAVAHQTRFGKGAKVAPGVDLGVAYRALRHPVLGDHVVGVMGQNLLGPKVSEDDGGRYAANAKLSWLVSLFEGRVTTGVDVDVKDFMAQGSTFLESEGSKKVEYDVNYRIGGWLFGVANSYFQAGSGFWGIGLGMNVPTVNNGRDLSILYQYMGLTEGAKASTHTIYLCLEVGKHREELYARKMARIASISPNELYNRAMRLYMSQKYWDAYFVFGQILAQFPDFFKNDWVRYYRGSCMEELDMRVRANETYAETKETYPKSNAVPYADLGIMRVWYRDDNREGVQSQFELLDKEGVADSLRHHANYLMGETYLRMGENKKAVQVFGRVPEGHPEYVFAQHSMGIARILDLDLDEAMLNLENCLQAPAETQAQQEVASRSALLLGYVFYEKFLLSKAVTALRMVPKSSYYYEDALVGLGWTALKASQWADCIEAGRDLAKLSKKPALKGEGWLLEAYGHLMKKDYQASSDALKKAGDLLDRSGSPSEDSLAEARRAYEDDRMEYGFLSAEVKRVSLVDPSEALQPIVDSLHREQKGTAKELLEYQKFADEFVRRRFFARELDRVRDDVEYAAAVVDKFLKRAAGAEAQAEMKKEQTDLDEEIEKLEQEMQEIHEEEGKRRGPETPPEEPAEEDESSSEEEDIESTEE